MNMKKMISMVLALVMLLAMSATAFAAEATITVADDRTYEVYQIFTGDLSGTTLSNVKWGENGTGTKGEAVPQGTLDALAALTNAEVDATKLIEIEKYVDLDSDPVETVSKSNSATVATGYYLLKDVTENLKDGAEYSEFVVKIVGPTEISGKVGAVTSEKKVKDTNDSEGSTTDWQDSADYDIGDDVPFLLKGTVTEKYDNYATYYYAFHDTLSAGLSFNNDVVVKVDGTTITSGYEVVTNDLTDGCSFEVRFADLKTVDAVKASSTITVEYTAELNSNAAIGFAGNPNTMYLQYSNNPNNEESTGETPEDKVIVFTYKVIVDKVTPELDANGNPVKVDGKVVYKALPGAGFTLYKKNASGAYVAVGEEVKDVTTFEWKGLDDGAYKLVESTTPAGYNTIAPIEFTISASHEEEADDPKLESLTVTGGDFTVVMVKDADENELISGELTGDVINEKGATLPETGAQGTKMIYIAGGILVAAAVILLITKRRMNAAE